METRYGLDGLVIESGGGGRFSVHIGPGAHPVSYSLGTGFFARIKRPVRGVDNPTLSRAEVKERVDLYVYSPSVSSWQVKG